MRTKPLLILLAVISLISITHISFSSYITASNTPTYGSAIISVFDKQDQTPINNATICIIETGDYYLTNKLGSIKFTLPAKNTNKLSLSNPNKNWQEYTLLVYSNGFYPHIYYGLKIVDNNTKTGIVIKLEKLSHNSSQNFTQEYEYPNDIWTLQLIKKYKK